MRVFDEDERERARTGLEFMRRADRADFLPHAVGNAATMGLGFAIRAWIVGLEEEARPVVEQCRAWLEDSISRDESYGDPPAYSAMLRVQALAIARWLLDATNPTSAFRETVRRHELAWAELAVLRDPVGGAWRRDYLPDYLRDCCSAAAWDRGAAAYERHGGRPLAGEDDIRTVLELAYWICRQHRDGDGAVASWTATGERLLSAVVDKWLDDGEDIRLAAWLKLVYWDAGATATPAESFARARLLGGARP